MEGPVYGAVEWTIVNFSCWNEKIHHEVITSLNFFGELHFEIRPRGGNRQMSVRILGDSPTEVSGDLSLVYTDGYVFCSAEVEIDTQKPAFELSSAPQFIDVVFRSEMNDGLHEDQITLRFHMRRAVSDSVLYMRTDIPMHELSVRISGEALYNICLYGTDAQSIRTIQYPTNDSATAKIDIYAGFENEYRCCHFKNSGLYNPQDMHFKIKQTGSPSTFICSRLSVINKDGKVARSICGECVCSDNECFMVMNFLTRTAVEEKRMDLLWRLRIILENKSELLCTSNTTDQGQTLPTVSLNHLTYNKYVQKPSENIKADTSNQPENPLTVLSKDFMCLYQDQKFSDITLKCDNVTFPVHKVILSARSPVLYRLLSSDMKEAASNEVDIEDLDPSTLSRFLTYLYTGAEEELQDDSALKLYYAVDKYQVPSLKTECNDFLCSNVSISNVCDILSLADKHSDDQLTSVAHDFILKNFNKVLSSDEWGRLVESDPVLVAKTVTYFAQKKSVRFFEF